MNEFLGIGRTWWMAILLILGTTIMFAMGKLTVEQWQSMVQWAFTIAGGKSAIIGATKAYKNGGN